MLCIIALGILESLSTLKVTLWGHTKSDYVYRRYVFVVTLPTSASTSSDFNR
jgi:hypothetical protein